LRFREDQMDKYALITFMSVFARFWHRPLAATEGTATSGETLREVARLSQAEALQRLRSAPDGLAPDEVTKRLRLFGPK
jgi:hypothetical protein